MAKCEIKLPDELYKSIEKLSGRQDEILKSTLEAGGEIVLKAVRNNLNHAITNSSMRSTGELKNSLGMSPVKKSSRGIYNIKIDLQSQDANNMPPKRKEVATQ